MYTDGRCFDKSDPSDSGSVDQERMSSDLRLFSPHHVTSRLQQVISCDISRLLY
jgi:hypothetical protein